MNEHEAARLLIEKLDKVLLWGLPGTQKTTIAIQSAGNREVFSITLHSESSVSELIGHWVPQGDKFTWHYGPASLAWMQGGMLILNEIGEASGAVMTLLHAILDDHSVARLTLPNNETIFPKEGFKVVATTNLSPEELPPPLLDRFQARIALNEPSEEALSSLPKEIREILRNFYKSGEPHLTFRETVSLLKISDILGGSLEKALSFLISSSDKRKELANVLKIGAREEDKNDKTTLL